MDKARKISKIKKEFFGTANRSRPSKVTKQKASKNPRATQHSPLQDSEGNALLFQQAVLKAFQSKEFSNQKLNCLSIFLSKLAEAYSFDKNLIKRLLEEEKPKDLYELKMAFQKEQLNNLIK